MLARKLAEKSKQVEILDQKAQDAENEVQVLKRKHASRCDIMAYIYLKFVQNWGEGTPVCRFNGKTGKVMSRFSGF